MNWNHLLDHEKNGFYTQFLMLLLSLFVVILYFSIKPKTKALIYLAIMAAASLMDSIFSDCTYLTKDTTIKEIYGAIKIIYPFIEVFCCLLFIKSCIQSQLAKKIILFSLIILVICFATRSIIFFLAIPSSHDAYIKTNVSNSINLYAILGFLVFMASLYFFCELVIYSTLKARSGISSIWSVSGMLVLSGTLTPFSLFSFYLYENNPSIMHMLWPINYTIYSLLFIIFAIAIVSDKR